jgi:hypothetical protein
MKNQDSGNGSGTRRASSLVLGVLLLLVCAAYALSGGWSAPVSLSTPIPPTFYTTTPAVGINSSGAQAAAWINESNYLLLQVAARDAGGSWSKSQTLTPASGWNAAEPAVAVGPAGNAVAIWEIYEVNPPNLLVVQASARPAHGAWGPVVTVSPTSGSATVPQIAMDANGNAVAIWVQSGVIEAATLPAGGVWSAPVALSGTSASSPTLAVNARGDAVAGWKTSNGAIFVAERKSGAWTAPVSIAAPAYRAGGPHLALNGPGDAAIAWSGRGTTLVASRPANGVWISPTTISTSSAGLTARVALDDAGNAVAVFALVKLSGSSYVYPVQAVARTAGGAWGSAVTISGASDYSASINLVATPLGTFIAGWVDDNSLNVRSAIRPIGQAKFGAPVTLIGGSQLDLAVAPGNTAATWIGGGPSVQVSTNSTP